MLSAKSDTPSHKSRGAVTCAVRSTDSVATLPSEMKLICKSTKVLGRVLNIELADADTGNPFPIRMDEHGSYLHRHRGNRAFMTALETLENFTKVNGQPIRETWLTTLADHLKVPVASG